MTNESDGTTDAVTASIRWLGHAGVAVRSGRATILLDPVLRRRIAHIRRRTSIDEAHSTGVTTVCVSHAHHDHLDLASLRGIDRRSPSVEWHAPRGAARVLERAGFSPLVVRSVADEIDVGGVRISTVPAAHGGERYPFGRKDDEAEAVGYVLETADGTRIWFAGDTEYDDAIERIGPVDVALVPVGGWWRTLGPGHMDAEQAARAVRAVGARIAIPIHWGTYHPIGLHRFMRSTWFEPARDLARLVPSTVDVRILGIGEETLIDPVPR